MKKRLSSPTLPVFIRITFIIGIVLITVAIFSEIRQTKYAKGYVGQEVSRSVFAKILPSVVEIRLPGNLLGTGILVDADKVLTSAHIIQQGESLFVIQNTKQILVSSFMKHPEKDIAILFLAERFAGPSAHVIASQVSLRPGDTVFGFGSIDGSILGNQGIISSLSSTIFFGEHAFTDLILSDIPLQAGYSGGPLVNTSGEVIGIHTVLQTGARWGWSTPVDNEILEVLFSQKKQTLTSD